MFSWQHAQHLVFLLLLLLLPLLQEIQVDILIAVNHVGRMDMTLCDLDAKVGQDYKCRQLQR
jgi:hypothetical protein